MDNGSNCGGDPDILLSGPVVIPFLFTGTCLELRQGQGKPNIADSLE
jgi:hypothetical protein